MSLWTNDQISFLKTNYSTMDKQVILSNIGKTWSQIVDKASALRIKRTHKVHWKYSLDENYFDKLTERSAYFLGLMYADGYNNTEFHNICLSLQEDDKYILDAFLKDLSTNRPLLKINSKNIRHKTQYKIQIKNKHMSEQLKIFGCVQAKTKIITFPEIPKELVSHFIRGYFDGDGCVYIDKKKTIHTTIIGTESFCLSINKFLGNIGNIYPSNSEYVKVLRFGGNKKARKFAKYIYTNSSIYFERKFNKYELLL